MEIEWNLKFPLKFRLNTMEIEYPRFVVEIRGEGLKYAFTVYFSMKPAKKTFRLLGGKIKFELALQPSTASTAKIQILFSRQGVLRFFGGFHRKISL